VWHQHIIGFDLMPIKAESVERLEIDFWMLWKSKAVRLVRAPYLFDFNQAIGMTSHSSHFDISLNIENLQNHFKEVVIKTAST
jgi:hypothetical protein